MYNRMATITKHVKQFFKFSTKKPFLQAHLKPSYSQKCSTSLTHSSKCRRSILYGSFFIVGAYYYQQSSKHDSTSLGHFHQYLEKLIFVVRNIRELHLLNSCKFLHVHAAEVFKEPNYPQSTLLPTNKSNNFIADVVEKVSPAVVYIEIKGRHPFSSQWIPTSAGSGFIVHEDGVILTNAHVVANKVRVEVKLQDGRTCEGVVQYVDPVSDLATVKVNIADKLPVIKLGDSSTSRPGEWVVAMGSPLSLSNTVTAGVISSVGRGSHELGLHYKDMSYIQTDASITIGNSGGPLVNLNGEAIGINTMTATAGISFAIPSNHAKSFLKQVEVLETNKKSSMKGWFGGGGDAAANKSKEETNLGKRRRYVGITMLTLSPDIVEAIRWRNTHFPNVTSGVLVQRVQPESPAYRSGLRSGDVITKLDNSPCAASSDVYKALESKDHLHLEVLRGRHTLNITVTPEIVGA